VTGLSGHCTAGQLPNAKSAWQASSNLRWSRMGRSSVTARRVPGPDHGPAGLLRGLHGECAGQFRLRLRGSPRGTAGAGQPPPPVGGPGPVQCLGHAEYRRALARRTGRRPGRQAESTTRNDSRSGPGAERPPAFIVPG
jgi:hypothetical protein